MADKKRVARYQADRTNQKFYFSRLACKQAAQSQDKQLYQASCETAIFHLQGAYLAFLQELCGFYGLKREAPTWQFIEEQLAKKTLISPEIQRLKQALSSGVLANIMNAFERCQYAPISESTKSATPVPDLVVNVVTLSSYWLPDEQTIREWRHEFMALVEEMRGGMLEY